MGFGKWVKKKSAQATKSAGKRYGMSYGRKGFRMSKNSLSKVAKDVMMIKSQLNVEKKYVDTAEVVKGSVGQVKINDQGFLALDLTPTITQGVAESPRVCVCVCMCVPKMRASSRRSPPRRQECACVRV